MSEFMSPESRVIRHRLVEDLFYAIHAASPEPIGNAVAYKEGSALLGCAVSTFRDWHTKHRTPTSLMYLIRLGDRVNSFYINGKMSRSHPHIEWMVAVTRSGNDSMVKMVRMEDGKITHQVLDSTKTVWRKNGQTRPGGGVWNRSPKTDVNREYTNEKRRDHSDQARRDRTKAARAALAEKRRNKKMELPDSVKPFIDLEKPKKASKQKRRGPYKPRDIQITNTEMMDRMRSTEQRLSMDIIKARHDLQSYSDLQASKMNMKILGAMVVCVFGVVIYHAVSELISLM